jgi:hypothetical protein
LASLGSNLDGGGWTSWSIAWLSLEFSGAIAAVLMLLLQNDLRQQGFTKSRTDRKKNPFSVPPESEAQDRRTRDTVQSPKSSLTAAAGPAAWGTQWEHSLGNVAVVDRMVLLFF